jgi:FkbM family methyltransferase
MRTIKATKMWAAANNLLKKHCRPAHRLLKSTAGSWLRGSLPAPRSIAGHLVWTQPRLLTAQAPEPHVLGWISESLSRGNTFFDVGAHYGWLSIAAAHRVGPFGRVVAFEPSPANADILSYHKRINRLRQIEILRKAVSDSDSDSVPFFLVNGGLSFRNSLTIGPNETLHVTPAEKTRTEVPSITLDRFCLDSGSYPDLIKIDVEGAELLVLRGAENLLARGKARLILGVHPYWLPRSQCVQQVWDLLGRHGYRVQDERRTEFDGGYVADYLCTA